MCNSDAFEKNILIIEIYNEKLFLNTYNRYVERSEGKLSYSCIMYVDLFNDDFKVQQKTHTLLVKNILFL